MSSYTSTPGYVLLKLFRAGYLGLNSCSKLVCGYSFSGGQQSSKKVQQECYEQSAHVLKVVMKYRNYELEGPTRANFLLRHEEYAHPRIILQENVTLLTLDVEYAIFTICPKEVFSYTSGPFSYINQFNYCTKVILIPLKFFNRLAEEVGDPPGHLVLLANTGRCGSTLLTQLFEAMPNTVAISEPEILTKFGYDNTFDDFPKAERLKLLKSCIRMLCKSARINSDNILPTILFKPKNFALSVAKELAELYPNMKHLYMYRTPIDFVNSVAAVYQSLLRSFATKVLVFIMSKTTMKEVALKQFKRLQGTKPSKYELMLIEATKDLNFDSTFIQFATLYCGNILKMMQLSNEEGIRFHIVSYNQLVDEPDASMKSILKHCGIPTDKNYICQLPERDSQKNTKLSRSQVQSFRASQTTEKDISEIDAVLKGCGFPVCQNFPRKSEDFVRDFHL